jgi:hypothetical protein
MDQEREYNMEQEPQLGVVQHNHSFDTQVP